VRNDPEAWCGCVGGSLVASDYESVLRDIGYENVSLQWLDSSCGESCSTSTVQSLAVAVTAHKPESAHPGTALRPAVPADRDTIEALLKTEGLPTDGLSIEDTLVAIEQDTVAGAVALERFGNASMLRSLVVEPGQRQKGIGHRLVYGALEVARWSGVAEVHLLTDDAQRFFAPFGFEAVSGQLTREACADSALVAGQCCTTATAMRLVFEDAEVPVLDKPSRKELPSFANNSCC
jgi:N-acetylglutamate synthase-like GNAT family acetyltransferase